MSLTKVSFSMITGEVANVLDFGADPTGVSDSSAAIQAAITARQQVYIPQGVYRINTALTPSNAQSIFGDGVNQTRLRAGTVGMTVIDFPSGSYSNVIIKNLTIEGDAKADRGISFIGSVQGAVSNCEFNNITIAGCIDYQFYGENLTYCVWDRVAFDGLNGDYGLFLRECFSSEIKNSLMYNGNAANMITDGCSIVNFSNTHFFNEATNPSPALVIVDNSNACAFVDCTFEPQGNANVSYNVVLKDTNPAFPNCTDNAFTRCQFIGGGGTSNGCVAIGTAGFVYKTRFTECGFIKPTGFSSINLTAQDQTSFSRCYDLVTYDTPTYQPVTITNISGNGFFIENLTGEFGLLRPIGDNTIDLGSAVAHWKDAYVKTVSFGDGSRFITTGTGSPEGVVSSGLGSLFLRTDGGVGTSLYVKEQNNGGNTGWAAK